MKIIYGGTTWNFPTLSRVKKRSYDVRNNEVKRAFSHGAIENGDGKIESRIIEVESLLDAASESAFLTLADAIHAAVYRRDYKLFLEDTRYINVSALDKFNQEYSDGYITRAKVTMAFRCCDPFFYALTQTSAVQAASASPFQFTVNNPGTVDTPLTVTFSPAAAAADIKLTNVTDGGRAFTYKDTLLISPAETTVNGATGTVYRGSSNSINAFTGTFLKLLPGDNVLKYEGAAGNITTAFTARYL